ncbi:SdpA family antimicrobial peptide system protein [Streptomyces antimicrobicus]|uniref:SdpA family antimicrobial peptide system protein n=1 Tax=Streptomyces antimicrobicus TaxID=2883108 RepID=A0ABS8BBJ2_9ACTN|nr:SdpA family antimicrobial peptide system protein [Streptomyces antimicrobicus]MCB5182000.1 SdpA family antimicrobial peptide system protein [Streptomyces antimicrobicus]
MKKKFRTACAAFTRSGAGQVSVSLKSVTIACAVWSVIVLYAVQEQVPKNVITLPAQTKVKHTVVNIAPQGWAFFTKSPRDPEVVPYKKTPDGWQALSLTPHASPHNAFGLNRESRAQGVEIAMLLSAAQKSDWRDCTDSSETCLANAGNVSRRLTNGTPHPTLCGTVGLLQERPTPYAWRDLVATSHSPERVMILEVTC